MPDETEVEIESTEFVDTLETTDTEVVEEPGDLYVIKVDGEEQEVSLEELRNGYQRQADYWKIIQRRHFKYWQNLLMLEHLLMLQTPQIGKS